jgi:spore coat-associated protein N
MQGATRIESLVRRPKRTLGGLVTALIAIGVAVGTGANFSAEATNPSNTFTAGIVKMDNSKDNAAIISATNMKPGAPPDKGTVDIKNSGSMDMVVTLKRDMLGTYETGAPDPVQMTSKINLTITDCGRFADDGTAPACGDTNDHAVYAGTLDAMNDPIALGTFAKDEKHRYQFAAALDYTTGNEYANEAGLARFVWTGDQTR